VNGYSYDRQHRSQRVREGLSKGRDLCVLRDWISEEIIPFAESNQHVKVNGDKGFEIFSEEGALQDLSCDVVMDHLSIRVSQLELA
jgi:hypothetical protein